jgi:hypothetical protein
MIVDSKVILQLRHNYSCLSPQRLDFGPMALIVTFHIRFEALASDGVTITFASAFGDTLVTALKATASPPRAHC